MWDLRARNILACFCLTMLATFAMAQEESSLTVPAIGLPEALARTMARNPDLIAFGYQIEAAEGLLLQADLKPYPQLEIDVEDAFGTGVFEGTERMDLTVTLGWVL